MRFRIVCLCCLALLFMSGCYQQLGPELQETLVGVQEQPIPASATPMDPESSPLPPDDATPTPLAPVVDATQPGSVLATPTLSIAITVLSPTRVAPAAATPSPVAPAATETVTSNTVLITPVSPLGPVTPAPTVASVVGQPQPATPSGLITPTAFTPGVNAEACTVTVQSGDSLFQIALRNEVDLAALRAANPDVVGDLIQPGQVLNLPNCGELGVVATAAFPGPTALPATPLPDGSTTYTIQRGDTLFTIAQRFGVTVQAIQDANTIANPNRITAGQEIIIPPRSP